MTEVNREGRHIIPNDKSLTVGALKVFLSNSPDSAAVHIEPGGDDPMIVTEWAE